MDNGSTIATNQSTDQSTDPAEFPFDVWHHRAPRTSPVWVESRRSGLSRDEHSCPSSTPASSSALLSRSASRRDTAAESVNDQRHHPASQHQFRRFTACILTAPVLPPLFRSRHETGTEKCYKDPLDSENNRCRIGETTLGKNLYL